jgi:K+-sensing histidine kinase KdpD
MIAHTVILSVLINLLENISQYDISHSDIVSINKPSYWKVTVSMISLVILSVLINLLESISQYDVSHSDIVSINKPTGKYQSV